MATGAVYASSCWMSTVMGKSAAICESYCVFTQTTSGSRTGTPPMVSVKAAGAIGPDWPAVLFTVTFRAQTLLMDPGTDSADTNCASPDTDTGSVSAVAGLNAIAPVLRPALAAPRPLTKNVMVEFTTAGFAQLFIEPSAFNATGRNDAVI